MPSHITIGHIGLLDSIPLLVAQSAGFLADEELSVTLSCELGLASVCGRLAEGRLDGACLPAPLPVLLSLGSGVARVQMQVVAMMTWQGMGVVLGRGAPPPGLQPLRVGVAGPGTAARLILHKLGQTPGAALGGEVTQVQIAASQLVDFLREGMVNGICAPDPLPALALSVAGTRSAGHGGELFAGHPGGVLALRSEHADMRPGLAAAMERAVARARDWCADPARAEEIWKMVLSQAPYAELGADARDAVVAKALAGGVAASTRFVAPSGTAWQPGRTEVFLENACRGAATAAIRPQDLRAEIIRVYAALTRPELGRVS